MNVGTMRVVDRWIGVPMCAALTLVRRLDDLILRRSPERHPRRIAVVKLAEQGATVVAYPALVRAREEIGAENLFFVAFEPNRFIVDLLRIVPPENVLAIRTEGLVRTLLDTLRVVWRMRQLRIDATIDCEFFARSTAILSYLSGARSRIGFHAYNTEASWRGDLMTHRLSYNAHQHASEVFRMLVEAVWLSPERMPSCDVVLPEADSPPLHQPAPERLDEIRTILRGSLGNETLGPLILLNANCSDLLPLRRWRPERYVDLAQRLVERFPEVAVVFTGAPDEAVAAQDLADRVASPRCANLAGKTTLEQLFALYTLSELMVTNDSGPAHYATVTPIDVITIFGPETPASFGARSPRSHLMWAGLACSPCVNAFNDRSSACTNNVCMDRIEVDEVFDLACRVYESRTAGTQQAQSVRS